MILLSLQRPVTHLAPTPNCTKWMLALAGDVNVCQKNNKGCICVHIHASPLSSHPLRCWFPLCFSCMFTHTRKNKQAHTDQNMHAHVQIEILWYSRSSPLERGNYFTVDWAHGCVTWSEESVCLFVWALIRKLTVLNRAKEIICWYLGCRYF